MIQRFEYCTDLLWKLLKIYLEDIEKVDLPTYSPRGIIRQAVSIKTISEEQGSLCMQMIENRNEKSHIYHAETAQEIAENVPTFYELMQNIVSKIKDKIKKYQ